MKWYYLSCDSCEWRSQRPVDEATLRRFLKEVGEFCRHCLHHKRIKVKYGIREVITNTRRR